MCILKNFSIFNQISVMNQYFMHISILCPTPLVRDKVGQCGDLTFDIIKSPSLEWVFIIKSLYSGWEIVMVSRGFDTVLIDDYH